MAQIETLLSIVKEAQKEQLLKEGGEHQEFVDKQFERLNDPERRFKYFWFLKALNSYKLIDKTRGLFLKDYYALMRYWDDIADGDSEVPEEFKDRAECLEDALNFVSKEDTENAELESHKLADYCFRLGDSFGQDFRKQAQELVEHMLFDAKRRGTNHVTPTKAEIEAHFENEISGCAKATIRIFGEDQKSYEGISLLARAVQIYYTLRDFHENVEQGIIDISGEEMQKFGILQEDLKDPNNPKVKDWFRSEARRGLDLMKEYEKQIDSYELKKITKTTLDIVFQLKAKLFLEDIVKKR